MIYLAGPLFTSAEQLWNKDVSHALETMGHEVFLPQVDAPRLAEGYVADEDIPLYLALSKACRQGVRQCDVVVACVDGADADSGTCWELGYAAGRGVPCYWYRTDFRKDADSPAGVNLMIVGHAEELDLGVAFNGSPYTVAKVIHEALS